MAQVTGYTATRMKAIEDSAIVDGDVVGNDLILKRFDGQLINAGSVRGPIGLTGPTGPVPEAPLNTTSYIRKNGLWVPGTEAPIRDTLANLNANNPAVDVGRMVIATDSNPRRFAIGNGVDTWSNLVKYYERSTPQSASTQAVQVASLNPNYIDRTGMSVTFTVGDTPWTVIGSEPLIYGTTAGVGPVLAIRDAANVLKEASYGTASSVLTNNIYYASAPPVIEKITIPGTYTRKLSVMNYGSGTLTFGVNPGNFTAHLIARPL